MTWLERQVRAVSMRRMLLSLAAIAAAEGLLGRTGARANMRAGVSRLSPAAGARFRDEVLARGGSRPAMESFVAFRGRPPALDALLRHHGMATTA